MNVETRYCRRCESQTVGERDRCYECGSTSWQEGRLVRYRMRGGESDLWHNLPARSTCSVSSARAVS